MKTPILLVLDLLLTEPRIQHERSIASAPVKHESFASQKADNKTVCLATLFDFFTDKAPAPRSDCAYSVGRPLKVSMTYDGGFMVKIGSKPLYVETTKEVKEGDVIEEGSFDYLRTESHGYYGEYHTFKMD